MNHISSTPSLFTLLLCGCLALFSGCQDAEDSPVMKEARALHEESNAVALSLEQRLELIQEDLSARLQGSMEQEKTDQLSSVLEQVNAIEGRYETWMSEQVLLPGATCNHDHGDGEHHHHHHHASMDDLLDGDHLELQKAIREELDGLVNDLNAIRP